MIVWFDSLPCVFVVIVCCDRLSRLFFDGVSRLFVMLGSCERGVCCLNVDA